MDLRQLEIFTAVAQCRSFSKAAKQLHIVQPAISIAIKKLEQEFELTLFDRASKKGVQLTPEGEVLYKHAKSLLSQQQAATVEMQELRGLQQGEVRIAMPAMHGSYYFPDIFCEFKQRYPGMCIQVIEAGTREVEDRLLNGDCELGVVMSSMQHDALQAHPLIKEQMLACVGKDHEFSKLPSVRFEDFVKQPLILTRKGYFMREIIDKLCKEHDLNPNISVQTNLMLLTKQLLLNNQGVSTCMSMVLESEKELVGIAFKPKIYFDMAIAWNKNSYLSHANRAFVEFLLNR